MGFKSITVGFAGGVKERRARGATDGTRDKTRRAQVNETPGAKTDQTQRNPAKPGQTQPNPAKPSQTQLKPAKTS